MARKVADCRAIPSDSHCSLTISGEENEVLDAATQHAVSKHGHQMGPELREKIRGSLEDESEFAHRTFPPKTGGKQPGTTRVPI